jgi:hypothetical protein
VTRNPPATRAPGQRWFPTGLTLLIHEFLVWFVGRARAARPFVPFLVEALAHARSRTIVDVETGAGSGAATVLPELPEGVEVVSRQHGDLRVDTQGYMR